MAFAFGGVVIVLIITVIGFGAVCVWKNGIN